MEDCDKFTPRNYQVELVEIASKQNTIIFLPTGSGKTFIAMLLMKRMAADLIGENKKNTVILVNTIALVNQHSKYVKEHTTFSVGQYSGDQNVDSWDKSKWLIEIERYQILIMTSQIFCNIVTWNILDLQRVNLIIFDECHRGVSDHSMRQLMLNFQNVTIQPRVLGLTATLLNGNCKPNRVMQEVRALEVTYHSKVATVDGLEHVVGFSTNPHEIVKSYASHSSTALEADAILELNRLKGVLGSIKIQPKEIPQKIKAYNLKILDPDAGVKKLINLITDLELHIEMLGTFGGSKTCIAHIIQLERFKRNCISPELMHILNYMHTVIGYVLHQFLKAMESYTEIEKVYKFSSHKVLTLFAVLDDFRQNSTEEICGLIFVQRRFTAKIVHHILEHLSAHDPKFNNIKSNFMVGFNCNPFVDSRESLYLNKMNKQVLEKFCNKEINILVASDVLEEGVDVPKCTLVCKFDKPSDYRSYIQSKGRARHHLSRYYMMIENSDIQAFAEKYNEFQMVEKTLNDYLIGKNQEREDPSQAELDDMYNEHEIPPYYVDGPNSAQVNLVTAIPLLCQYCNSLPSDQYTTYAPEWYVGHETSQTEITSIRKVGVVIILPIVCPILEPIVGPLVGTKKLAKRAAALRACIALHKCKELDDNLLPRKRVIPEIDVSYLFPHYPENKEPGAGTSKMRRLHDIQIAKASKGKIAAAAEVYLHVIDLTPEFDKKPENFNVNTLHDLYTSNLCFGLISSKPLPSVCDFPIYVSSGTITVSMKLNQLKITLTAEEIGKLKEFHFLIFNDILEILKPLLIISNSAENETFLVVPIRKDLNCIDLHVIDTYRTIKNKTQEPSAKEKLTLVVNDESYLHKIVIPWYRRDSSVYLVTKVCEHMTPRSDFPNADYNDFIDYYREKHLLNIVNQKQPLLFVKSLSKRLNLFKPRGREGKRKKEKLYEEMEEYLIPEMLVKQEFPACLWIQSNFLPTILSRFSYLLRLEELWSKISNDCGFARNTASMKPLQLNKHLLTYDPVMEEKRVKVPVHVNYENPELLSITSSAVSTQAYNKDYKSKLLESEYPWKDLEEPVDIERVLEVTILDIEHYETFIHHSVRGNDRDLKNISPVKQKTLPAITYNKDYVDRPIKLLKVPNTDDSVQLADIYEAMTTSKANDIVNLERKETLGDSFLKYITSFYIMLKFPHYDEGQATSLKGRLVSNKNLFYLARKNNLGGILKYSDLMPKEDYVPPSFSIPEELNEHIANKTLPLKCLFMVNIPYEEQIAGKISKETLAENFEDGFPADEVDNDYHMCEFLKKHYIGDKTCADVVEALLGVYFEKTGVEGCIKVMEWIGLIPASEGLAKFLRTPPKSPILSDTTRLQDIDMHIPQWAEIEDLLGYKFKNRAYLLQALTHSSYTPNRVTYSYEKLEFLGDAVLDFLITCCIFESYDKLNPGELTDLRSALVNNNTFASLVVRLGFHKFLLMMDSKLQRHIDKFAEYLAVKNYVIDDEVLILLEEDDVNNYNIAEYIDVPKVLGDVFEALAGAVFLDSGYNLEVVWKVFYKIMWREIDTFSQKVPKNMVRRLYECPSAHPQFSKAQPVNNSNKTVVALQFMVNGRPKYVHGFGTNKVMAKKAAAKLALRWLNA